MNIKFDNNKLVIKSNSIIEAKYKLNLTEQKIILFLVSLIQKNDEVFKLWRIKISDLAEFLGMNSKSAYRELKNATFKMLDRKLRLKLENRELQLNWLASADYFNDKGFVELEISEKLKPFLLQLKENFTTYRLKEIISLKSVYSIRIYELLRQYTKIGKRYFEITELKEKLGIDNKYPNYADVKKIIILPAQKELESKTDIAFDFEEKKEVRKVVGITFIIKENVNYKSDVIDIEKESDYSELFTKLKEYFKQSEEQAEWILKNVKEDDLKLALDVLEKRYRDNKIESLGAYTWVYFQKGQYISDVEKSRFDIEQKEKVEIKKREKAREELEKQLKQNYDNYVQDCIDNFEKSLSIKEKEFLKEQAAERTKEKNPNMDDLFRSSIAKLEYRIILGQETEKQSLIIPFEVWREKEVEKLKG